MGINVRIIIKYGFELIEYFAYLNNENIVSEEFQKGYMYNDKVIRYSQVKVVN